MFRETHVDSGFSSRYQNSARPTAQLWNTGVKERKIGKILRGLTKWTPKLGGQAVIKIVREISVESNHWTGTPKATRIVARMFRETHVDSEFSSRYQNSARPTV